MVTEPTKVFKINYFKIGLIIEPVVISLTIVGPESKNIQ